MNRVPTVGTVTGMSWCLSPLLEDGAAGETLVEEANSVRPRLRTGASVVGYLYAWFLSARAGFARVGFAGHSQHHETAFSGPVVPAQVRDANSREASRGKAAPRIGHIREI